jgi:hypothetical protein
MDHSYKNELKIFIIKMHLISNGWNRIYKRFLPTMECKFFSEADRIFYKVDNTLSHIAVLTNTKINFKQYLVFFQIIIE